MIGRINRRISEMLRQIRAIRSDEESQVPADWGRWLSMQLTGHGRGVYWPIHSSSMVSFPKRILIGVETSPGWSPGCLISGMNGIRIGDFTQISQNVAIVSGNHDPYFLPDHIAAPPIDIGKYCLLGFGAVVMPGVTLGDYTIVGANTVVTKSFPQGHVVLAGAPAQVIKTLDPKSARRIERQNGYHGYVPAKEFTLFARQNLMLPEPLSTKYL